MIVVTDQEAEVVLHEVTVIERVATDAETWVMLLPRRVLVLRRASSSQPLEEVSVGDVALLLHLSKMLNVRVSISDRR